MDAVEEVKSRIGIEDVIAEYVQLRRAGRNFKGLSPFGNEKTPSFIVSPEKQIWHDFSSGKGGDMFTFVMEVEGLDFKGALELLARKAGVDLSKYQMGASGNSVKLKERLYELLDLAMRFYQAQFKTNQVALAYILTKRQFTKETALEWHLGYSPNNGSALVTFLKTKKFTEQEISDAGLSARAYRGGIQDMFRGRIMIPLQDAQGRVIGFTARLLADDPNAPKYINTPQTMLYDKSRHVYGLHLAKESIRNKQYAVLVEGNLDVIASHQAGVRNVVATAGTAITEQHLKALRRFTGDIRLCFDADKAGVTATERAIPLASKAGVSLSIIDIPSGKDPDELIKQDARTWEAIVERPKYALDWLAERYEKIFDITTAEGKRKYSDILLPIVQSLQDDVEQDHYLRKISENIGVSKEALVTKMQKTDAVEKRPLKRRQATSAERDKATVESIKVQDHLLALALLHRSLRAYLQMVSIGMFSQEPARELFTFLAKHPDFSGDASSAQELQSISDYVKILVLQYEELYQGLEQLELQYEAARLQTRVVEQFVKITKQKLVTQLESADDEMTQTLLRRVKQLDLLLKQAKGGTNG